MLSAIEGLNPSTNFELWEAFVEKIRRQCVDLSDDEESLSLQQVYDGLRLLRDEFWKSSVDFIEGLLWLVCLSVCFFNSFFVSFLDPQLLAWAESGGDILTMHLYTKSW